MTNNPLVEVLREKIAAARKTADDIRYYSGGSQRNHHAEELAEYLMNCAGDDLLAALASSAPATGEREQIVAWQPIETAWKVGRAPIIVTDGQAVHGGAWWHPGECVWLDCDGIVPTHWQPLPEPPADHRTQSGEMEGGEHG